MVRAHIVPKYVVTYTWNVYVTTWNTLNSTSVTYNVAFSTKICSKISNKFALIGAMKINPLFNKVDMSEFLV